MTEGKTNILVDYYIAKDVDYLETEAKWVEFTIQLDQYLGGKYIVEIAMRAPAYNHVLQFSPDEIREMYYAMGEMIRIWDRKK